ncbi:hypothetical protein COLO4_15646 [Corchorus olitorius]|uniref:UBA domain-containing protein n=1 Tax=Corchorus olitorius TaxID=93759 RepID=A0A1R3JLX7_9ROSI|nr:hypothetical protein COLO4_15646 [Corchorus olitorius]
MTLLCFSSSPYSVYIYINYNHNPIPSLTFEAEIPVMEVQMKLLGELEALGFPRARAVRALHHSGNTTLEAAVNWLIDHENDADIDQMPLVRYNIPDDYLVEAVNSNLSLRNAAELMHVAINMDIESPEPSDITEAIKIKEQELRTHFMFDADFYFVKTHTTLFNLFLFMLIKLLTLRNRVRIKKEEEEKKREREREKERIRAGKQLLEAKRIAEENERQRLLALRKAEKEEERRAREKVLKKLEVDKLERKRALGLPLESRAVKPSRPVNQEKKNSLPVKSIKKDERMRECLVSLKHTYKDDNARVRRAFQTLLIYVGNVARNPDEDKFRKIRLGNPKFQERVGSLQGGIEFLELCGFETSEGNELLVIPREKVDIALLNSAGSLLQSAITNPFFGLLQHTRDD